MVFSFASLTDGMTPATGVEAGAEAEAAAAMLAASNVRRLIIKS